MASWRSTKAFLAPVFVFPLFVLSLLFQRATPRERERTVPSPQPAKKRARNSREPRWLSKKDTRSRLLSGNLRWFDEDGCRGGKWHYRRHFTSFYPLYREMEGLITELECLERERGFLTPAQQRLYLDLTGDLPTVEGQLEELGGEG